MTDETTIPARLTMRDCCAILRIHKSTFKRKVKIGEFGTGVSTGAQSKPGDVRRFFTYEDIRKPEGWIPPALEPDDDAKEEDLIDTIAPIVHEAESELPAPKDFAADYRAGRATDSAGNDVLGRNKNWSETTSLLGPMAPGHQEPTDSQSHMSDVHFRNQPDKLGTDGQPIVHAGSNNNPLLSDEFRSPEYIARHRASVQKFEHRFGKGHSQAEQRAASERAQQNIKSAFPKP